MTTKAQPNYSNGKVYKIEPINSNNPDDIYIGSTTKKYLSQRFPAHKTAYKNNKKHQ